MKKLNIVIFLIITLVSCSNNKIVFKNTTKPNKKYQIISTISSDSEIDFIGNNKIINEIKSSGLTLPFRAQTDQELIIFYKTGNINSDSTFPIEVSFEKTTTKTKINDYEDSKNGPLLGVIVKGLANEQNKIFIDTVISNNINEDQKQFLKKLLENLQNQIKFPEKYLQIGDTFQIITPMEIPIPGISPIKFTVITSYNFIEISSEVAKFEIVQKLVMDINSTEMNSNSVGGGKGILDYNTKYNVVTKYEVELVMQMNMLHSDLEINAKINSKVKQLTTVN